MGLSSNQKGLISALLSDKLESKLARYSRESTSMPFLATLMQNKEQVAAYSFIHSLSTTLGMSMYEDISKIIAEEHSEECSTKHDIGGLISANQKSVIDNILRELRNGERVSDINRETEEVLRANPENGRPQSEGRIADLYMLRDGIEHYFEIKTVKPNIDVFAKSKSKLLEWVARRRKVVKVFVAFPYNPYHPQPYERFTLQGLLTPSKDLLIGKEYWDFLGGGNIFEELLDLFDAVGRRYKDRIADKIREVANLRMDT